MINTFRISTLLNQTGLAVTLALLLSSTALADEPAKGKRGEVKRVSQLFGVTFNSTLIITTNNTTIKALVAGDVKSDTAVHILSVDTNTTPGIAYRFDPTYHTLVDNSSTKYQATEITGYNPDNKLKIKINDVQGLGFKNTLMNNGEYWITTSLAPPLNTSIYIHTNGDQFVQPDRYTFKLELIAYLP